MDTIRYQEVDAANGGLTPIELEAGWHFCAEWDGLLIGPGWGELVACTCYPVDHPVRLECKRMADLRDQQAEYEYWTSVAESEQARADLDKLHNI